MPRELVRVVVVVDVVVLLLEFCAKTKLPKFKTKISARTIPSLVFFMLLSCQRVSFDSIIYFLRAVHKNLIEQPTSSGLPATTPLHYVLSKGHTTLLKTVKASFAEVS
jgi:hypothetical protein